MPTRRPRSKKKAPLKYKLTRAKKAKDGIDYVKTIEFAHRKHDGNKVIDTIDAIDWNRFKTLQNKAVDKEGKHVPFPRGVYVTYILKTGRKYHRITDITPRGLHIDKHNVKKWLKESLQKLIDKTELDDIDGDEDGDDGEPETDAKKYEKDRIDFSKTKLLSIEIKYIYEKPEKTKFPNPFA